MALKGVHNPKGGALEQLIPAVDAAKRNHASELAKKLYRGADESGQKALNAQHNGNFVKEVNTKVAPSPQMNKVLDTPKSDLSRGMISKVNKNGSNVHTNGSISTPEGKEMAVKRALNKEVEATGFIDPVEFAQTKAIKRTL